MGEKINYKLLAIKSRKKKLWVLTNKGQIDAEISGRWIEVINTTSINATISFLNCFDFQLWVLWIVSNGEKHSLAAYAC